MANVAIGNRLEIKSEDIGREIEIGHLSLAQAHLACQPIQKKGDRHIESCRQMQKLGRADSVLALFIFLNLLKRNADCSRQRRLGKLQLFPTTANPGTDELIDSIRRISSACLTW